MADLSRILDAFEELLYFRLVHDKDLLLDDLTELLEHWYALRRRVEEAGEAGSAGSQEKRIATAACALPRNDMNEKPAGGASPSPAKDKETTGGAERERERDGRLAGFAPAAPDKSHVFAGRGAALKRATLDKLEKTRAAGVTTAYLVKASGGALTIEELQRILAHEKVPLAAWEALADTLASLENKREDT